MKALRLATLALLALSAPTVLCVPAAPGKTPRLLANACGEPAGFGNGNISQVVSTRSPGEQLAPLPGSGGLYATPGYADPRTHESSGRRQARFAAESSGTVTLGALEVLDSGPTGPMSVDALDSATDEVTTQVPGHIARRRHAGPVQDSLH